MAGLTLPLIVQSKERTTGLPAEQGPVGTFPRMSGGVWPQLGRSREPKAASAQSINHQRESDQQPSRWHSNVLHTQHPGLQWMGQ